ncbi:MAM domain-containing glycosylphosphatidylinositol anchor protein 1 [Exaiptasia diaphana]|uniref:MAM domain-containing protein n=1 Tax=Exaiptasia diaphana TaxID=2652724 RepID=A0A913WT64_EXADI|nr:MAM domain-containing glycosylphosphatidylinositol anchor protein 1 [Exaiptasia diaphana]
METSHQYGKGQTAYLVSPEVAPSNSSHCLSFFYHMYGRTMGSLTVNIKDRQQNSVLSTITGNQGNSWHYKEVTITSLRTYQIVFVGVRGESHLSDIAIDNIKFKKAPCQKVPWLK